MKEFSATMKKQTYVGGVKTELTKEVLIQASLISSAYKIAKANNKGWTLDKKDVHEIIVDGDDA